MGEADRVRLVVLFGGRSAEHEVSCESALQVLKAVDPSRYDVHAIGITRSGEWVRPSRPVSELLAGGARALPSPDECAGDDHVPLPAGLTAGPGHQVVVFPLLHGPMGEDGTVQGMLELSGVPYVGAGVLASALCMDKAASKRMLEAEGLPVVRWLSARANEATPAFQEQAITDLGLPLFVKPANLGSSVGITKVSDRAAMAHAVDLALRYDERVVVEEAVVGREIEVAVLGDESPRASVAGEVQPSHDFYDFEDKYLAAAAGLVIPAPLESDQHTAVRELAVRAYRALRVDGMARVDFFLTSDGRFLINELNTIPGFTPISMYPKLWEATGLSYAALIDELVELAVVRHRRRSAFSVER
ncbi:MAG TPA: D-alanine--D-alanine ligase family protein [Acidimicrobiales bacterium]|nr:D-alanine--D-alanine ligase family protein [Acidimicrobiales bacterium]